jgi:RNA polymerase sigma-70 factor (ECF subfamily)
MVLEAQAEEMVMERGSDGFEASLGGPWDGFVDATADIRPEMFSFGLRLTRNPFDGEDLVQDALLRAFGAAAWQDGGIRDMRSYLFRTMANLWIDEQRRSREVVRELIDTVADESAARGDDAVMLRDVAERLFGELAPRERVAIVLHEAFGYRHAEIADLLSTTDGAIRSALHRAKTRLAAGTDTAFVTPDRVERGVVDKFVVAFSAADVPALRDLLLADVEAAVFPSGVGRGADWVVEHGWIRGCLYHHHPELERSGVPFPNEVRVVEIAGEPVVAVSRDGEGGVLLEEIWRFETEGGRIARVRDYGFCPDLVVWAAAETGLQARRAPYRFAHLPHIGER